MSFNYTLIISIINIIENICISSKFFEQKYVAHNIIIHNLKNYEVYSHKKSKKKKKKWTEETSCVAQGIISETIKRKVRAED